MKSRYKYRVKMRRAYTGTRSIAGALVVYGD